MATPPAMKIVPPYTPELLQSAQDYIEAYIKNREQTNVLEYGSGWSTIWFCQLGCKVASLEHSADWWLELIRALNEIRANNCLVYLNQPNNFLSFTNELSDKFDIVYVDCIDEYRIECAVAGMLKLNSGGLLVLDDTHWDLWKPLSNILYQYELVQVFEGQHKRKDGSIQYHHTTIYKKP